MAVIGVGVGAGDALPGVDGTFSLRGRFSGVVLNGHRAWPKLTEPRLRLTSMCSKGGQATIHPEPKHSNGHTSSVNGEHSAPGVRLLKDGKAI